MPMVMMGKGVVDVIKWGVDCEGEGGWFSVLVFGVQAGTNVVWDTGIERVST